MVACSNATRFFLSGERTVCPPVCGRLAIANFCPIQAVDKSVSAGLGNKHVRRVCCPEAHRCLALAIGWHQVLEGSNASVRESDCLVRIRDAGRNIRVIKWIEERITKEDEAAMVMRPNHGDAAKSEAVVGIMIWIGISGCVMHVNPCLSRPPAHIADRLLLR